MQNFLKNKYSRLAGVAALMLLGMGTAMAQAMMPGPGNSGASGVWTVYAYGNAQAVSDMFRGLANFVASEMFKSMVLFIALAGVLAVGGSAGFSSAIARKFVGYLMSVTLIVYIFFGFSAGSNNVLSVNIEVIDTVDSTWKSPVTVPAVVGIPAAIVSTAGFELLRQIEASFPSGPRGLPDGMKLSQGAPFNMAAALINDATKAKITDSNLSSSMAMYVQDCFIAAVARGEKDAATLLTSTDFLNDLRYNNPALLVNTFLPSGQSELVSCGEAHTRIATAVGNGDATDYLSNASAWASTPALNVVNSSADTVAQWATNNGVTDGASMIKQSAVLASFSGAFRQSAAQTGNSDFLTGLAITQAHQSQMNSWVTGAEIFNRTMGYVFAILQVFVYAVTPLILAAALIPGLGMALLKNFLQILLWLAVWQPMLGIVNFIILSMQQADLGGALNSGTSMGFALSNMGIITEKTSNMRAAATFVGTMVPALAWAMVKGSIDMSRIIGSAVGENFASSAANTMTTGNYSLNSASMDSFTANKHSVGQTFDAGKGFSSAASGGITNKNDIGGMTGVTSGDVNQNVATRADIGVGGSSQIGTAATKGTQGSNGTVASTAYGAGQSTGDATSAGHTGTSGVTNAITGQVNGSANLPLHQRGHSGGNPSAAIDPSGNAMGSAAGAGRGAGGEEAPKAGAVKNGLDNVIDMAKGLVPNLAVGASVTGAKVAQQAQQDSSGRNVTDSKTGSVSNGSQQTLGSQVVGGVQENAGSSQTASNNQSLAVTSLAPYAEQAAVRQQALHFSTGRFQRYEQRAGNDNEAVFYHRQDSGVGKAAQELSTSGHVVGANANVVAKSGAKEAALGKESSDMEAAALAKAAANKRMAEGQMANDRGDIRSMAPAAAVRPMDRVAAGASAAKDGAMSWLADSGAAVANMVKPGVDAVKDFASNMPLPASSIPGGVGMPAPVAQMAQNLTPGAPATALPQQQAGAPVAPQQAGAPVVQQQVVPPVAGPAAAPRAAAATQQPQAAPQAAQQAAQPAVQQVVVQQVTGTPQGPRQPQAPQAPTQPQGTPGPGGLESAMNAPRAEPAKASGGSIGNPRPAAASSNTGAPDEEKEKTPAIPRQTSGTNRAPD